MTFLSVVVLVLSAHLAASSMPGLPMRTFVAWDNTSSAGTAWMRANSFASDRNPLRYRYDFLPYCKHNIEPAPENLGEVLSGDAIYTTLYKATMRTSTHCMVACERFFTLNDIKRATRLIDRSFHAIFLFDNLPALQTYQEKCYTNPSVNPQDCRQRVGVPIGRSVPMAAATDKATKRAATSAAVADDTKRSVQALPFTRVGEVDANTAADVISADLRAEVEARLLNSLASGGFEAADDADADADTDAEHDTDAEVDAHVRTGATAATLVPWNKKRYFLNNHVAFDIRWHRPKSVPAWDHTQYRVVGFFAQSRSVDWAAATHGIGDCRNRTVHQDIIDKLPPLELVARPHTVGGKTKKLLPVVWTYSVKWSEDKETRWMTRWDIYFQASEYRPGIHWFALVNALLTVLFLSMIVALIMLRTLHRDFNRYNDTENAAEGIEETGWKQVHGDVFRRPPHANYLCAVVGTGVQLVLMVLITLTLTVTGMLAPSRRGVMLTVLLLLFVLLGFVGGYVSARMAKMWYVPSWMTTLLTATGVPVVVLGIFLAQNIAMWAKGAANAVPFSAVLSIFGLWLFASTPLVFIGAVVGYKQPAIEPVKRINELPRPVKALPWYLSPPWSFLCAGVLPFVTASLELSVLFRSVWQHKFHQFFGFVFAVYAIMLVVVAETVIVLTYQTLVCEDHRIWWNAFLLGASPAIHLLLYSVYYFATTLALAYGWSVARDVAKPAGIPRHEHPLKNGACLSGADHSSRPLHWRVDGPLRDAHVIPHVVCLRVSVCVCVRRTACAADTSSAATIEGCYFTPGGQSSSGTKCC
eukprot:TRINITY_DN1336_c0_g1_i5.p1 TRINITY_DN1336_c0_g1~~TRINITY_DN1336_c0_g1_i5.p1  ORF type:complete len:812 (-),score=155.98 TRINITY_DN1336_c0_g1_i5:1839-4274(-)